MKTPDNAITAAAQPRDRIYRNREPAKDPVAFSARQMSDAPKFWFRLPDEEQMLMKLTPAQFRCYHVVMRDIQRSKNAGYVAGTCKRPSSRTNSRRQSVAS